MVHQRQQDLLTPRNQSDREAVTLRDGPGGTTVRDDSEPAIDPRLQIGLVADWRQKRVMLKAHGCSINSIRQRGFSLIELMAALGVVATMLAFVIPSLTVASRNYKLKAFAKEIEGQLQNARISAINRNKSASLVFSSDNSWYYLDANGNGTADSGEPTYWVPTGGYTLNVAAPSTALSSTVLGTTSSPTALPNRGVSFSPRGSINQVSSSQVALSTKLSAPGVIYLKDSSNTYAAVTITSAGRIRSWTLRGTTWR